MVKTLLNLFLTLSLLGTTREPASWELPCIKSELQGLAIAAEVMDARESQYVFAKPSEIADDARFIRGIACGMRSRPTFTYMSDARR